MGKSTWKYIVKKEEFITKWLLSDVIETPFYAVPEADCFPNYSPGCSVKDAHGKERISPAKRQFLEAGIFQKSSYPENVKMEKLYYPFDTNRVDCSGFWTFPADITFYARAEIEAEQKGSRSFCIYANGAVKIWVNGKEQAQFAQYESNIEQNIKVMLSLEQGRNEIVVGCNDYGERNIQFQFGLQSLEESLTVVLPTAVDEEKINSVKEMLSSLYPEKLNYQRGRIRFCTEKPFSETVPFTVKVCGICKEIWAGQGENELVWGEVSELPMGYHEFRISALADGLELSTNLWAEVYSECVPMAAPQTYQDRAAEVIRFAVQEVQPSVDSYIAGLFQGMDRYEVCREAIEEKLELVNGRGDCADFAVLRFVWILKKFSQKITDEAAEMFKRALIDFRYWFDEPGNDAMWFFSENHALSFHVGELLAGELYPDLIFTNSGLTGREHMQKAKKRITEWFTKLFQYGYNEWNSASYISVDMLSYITLYELSENHEIREMAKRAMDMTYEIYASNSFRGVLAASNGRTYTKDLLANRTMSVDSQIWLAWGIGYLNQHVSPALYFAMSDYQPAEKLQKLADWNQEEKYFAEGEQGTFHVPVRVCKTKEYILATCHSPRTGYFGSQEHLLNVCLHDGQTRFWVNHPGEGKIFGQRRPGYFTGNGLTPLVEQKYNTAVMSWNFPAEFTERSEVGFTHLICDCSMCDQVIHEGKFIFVRREKAYAAFYASNEVEQTTNVSLKGMEFVSQGINGYWFVKISDEKEAGTFEEFICYMRENKPLQKGAALYYRDYEYGEMSFSLMEEDFAWKVLNLPAAKKLGLRRL